MVLTEKLFSIKKIKKPSDVVMITVDSQKAMDKTKLKFVFLSIFVLRSYTTLKYSDL